MRLRTLAKVMLCSAALLALSACGGGGGGAAPAAGNTACVLDAGKLDNCTLG